MKVLEIFSLLDHKAMRDFQGEQLRQGRSARSGKHGMFKLVRQVFLLQVRPLTACLRRFRLSMMCSTTRGRHGQKMMRTGSTTL